MSPDEEPTEVQSPAQRAEILAALACLLCLAGLFCVGKPISNFWLPWHVGWLIYLLLPVAVTFAILEVSCVHREMRTAMRAGFLLGLSLLIFLGACLALGAIGLIALADLPLSRFHY